MLCGYCVFGLSASTLAQIPTSPYDPIIEAGVSWKQKRGPVPDWLAISQDKAGRIDVCRLALRKEISPEYKGLALRLVTEDLADQTKISFFVNQTELDLLGVDPDTPITFSATEATVEEALRMILDPFELTYRITEIGIEITSKDAAESDPAIRYYDMAWVLDSSNDAPALIRTIQQSIDPDSWIQMGGTNTIQAVGSVMVVAAPDSTQRKIETLFGHLCHFKQLRDEADVPLAPIPPIPGN